VHRKKRMTPKDHESTFQLPSDSFNSGEQVQEVNILNVFGTWVASKPIHDYEVPKSAIFTFH